MWVSAFQTHSEWGAGVRGCRGPVEFLGLFLSYLVKGGEGSTSARCLWPFWEDVLPTSSFHSRFREAEVAGVVTRVTPGHPTGAAGQ